MSKRYLRAAVLAGLAVTAMTAGGCSGDLDGTKAGGTSRTVTLRIGTDDSPGLPSAAAIEEFARQVARTSNGHVTISPIWHAAGQPTPAAWDQVVARKVVSGELDLGLIPSRAWDTEGVTSLRALNAPFLVTSDSLVETIVGSALSDRLLGGLTDEGVTGLALFPEGMRHVFGWGTSLASPSDFADVMVRAPRSDTVYAMFDALGARAEDPDGLAFATGVEDGTIAGAESSFLLASQLPGRRPTTAGNVTLYPKVQSLVINSEAYRDLSDGDRAALRVAADATRDWVIERTPQEATSAGQFCDAGGVVVAASKADVAALRRAAQPIYDQLAQDGVTAEILAAIEQMRAAEEPDPIAAPCGRPGSQSSAKPAPSVRAEGGGNRFPEGVYRMEVTAEELVKAGAEEAWAGDVAGLWTLTFGNGKLSVVDINARSGLRHEDRGAYCVDSGRVTLDLFGDPATCGDGVYLSAGWTLKNGDLELVDITPNPDDTPADVNALWGDPGWRKIG